MREIALANRKVKQKPRRVTLGHPAWTNNPQVDDRDLRLADMRAWLRVEMLDAWTLVITRHCVRHYGFPRLSDLLYALNLYGIVRVQPEVCVFGEIIEQRRLILEGDFDEIAPLIKYGKFPLLNPNQGGKHVGTAVGACVNSRNRKLLQDAAQLMVDGGVHLIAISPSGPVPIEPDQIVDFIERGRGSAAAPLPSRAWPRKNRVKEVA